MIANHQIRYRALGYFFLMGYFWMLAINAMFLHSHKTSDGKVIVHAHPFDKKNENPNNQHKHHDADYVYCELAENVEPTEIRSNITVEESNVILPIAPSEVSFYYKLLFANNSKRGPPVTAQSLYHTLFPV